MRVQRFRIPGKHLNSRDKFLDTLGSKDSSWRNIQVYCEVFYCKGKMSYPNVAMGGGTSATQSPTMVAAPASNMSYVEEGDAFHTAKGDNAPSPSLVIIKHGPCPSMHTNSISGPAYGIIMTLPSLLSVLSS